MSQYQLVSINDITKRKTLLTNGVDPLTHKQACTMKSKFTPHKGVTLMLEPFKSFEDK